MSCIKSIQRGTYIAGGSESGEITITFNTPIDATKSVIFIETLDSRASVAYVSALTDTTFKSFGGTWYHTDNASSGYYVGVKIAYQIIEFA